MFSKQEQSGNRVRNGSIVGGSQTNHITNIVRSSNRTLERLYQKFSQEDGTMGGRIFVIS